VPAGEDDALARHLRCLFGRLSCGAYVWVLPCPFNEGKTASGQNEMFQLYLRISVVSEGSLRRERPGDFYGGAAASAPQAGGGLNHISRQISKSPAAGWANSGLLRDLPVNRDGAGERGSAGSSGLRAPRGRSGKAAPTGGLGAMIRGCAGGGVRGDR
jgi:hypothetical protein